MSNSTAASNSMAGGTGRFKMNLQIFASDTSSVQLTAGKNLKSHYIAHKRLLETVLDKEYSKFKNSNNAEEFLNELSEMINNENLKYVYKSTAQKMEIY